ncbi:MAG TPA: ATP synthase F0 subunit B [Candidatus Paceibacterota bacterium]
MSELFSQLGVNLPALIWQALNFAVVLVALTIFVYRPLSKMMSERAAKIAEGLRGADEAAERLHQIDVMRDKRMGEAEEEALVLIRKAGKDAEVHARNIITKGELRSEGIIKEAKTIAAREGEEAMRSVEHEARAFITSVLQKTVNLNPKDIDEKLIDQAVKLVRNAGV